MTTPPNKDSDLNETVVHSFDAVKSKDGGEPESVSASDTSSISVPVDKKPQNNGWIWISALLVLSTLFQSVKPSEPYIPGYWKNILHVSEKAVTAGPAYRSYAMTIMLPIVSYTSEYFIGYVPAIVFGLLCRWICQFTYFFGNSAFWLHASYAIFGLSHSTKTIYSAFTYTMVPVHVFHRITSYIRSANLVAHVLGGSLGNLIFHYAEPTVPQNEKVFSYTLMFTLSQICVGLGVLAFIVAIVLNYFYKVGSSDSLAKIKPPVPKSFREAWQLFRSIYYGPEMYILSLWFIFSFACVDAVWDYQSILFEKYQRKGQADYKGYVTALTRLGCAASAIFAGRTKHLYGRWDSTIIAICGGCVAFCQGLSSYTDNLYFIYAIFFVTMAINEFCICGVTAQIAVKTQQSLRGMALLVNMIFAMVFQSILQMLFDKLDFDVQYKYLGLSLCMFCFTAGMLIYMFGNYAQIFFRRLTGNVRQPANSNNINV